MQSNLEISLYTDAVLALCNSSCCHGELNCDQCFHSERSEEIRVDYKMIFKNLFAYKKIERDRKLKPDNPIVKKMSDCYQVPFLINRCHYASCVFSRAVILGILHSQSSISR